MMQSFDVTLKFAELFKLAEHVSISLCFQLAVGLPDASPCDSNPCNHGGTCVPMCHTQFRCRCTDDYQGPTCNECKREKNHVHLM